MTSKNTLQERFLQGRGQPVRLVDDIVVQLDRIPIPPRAVVRVAFVGDTVFSNNAAVLSVAKPGRIFLSDGTTTSSLLIWDEIGLAREARHEIDSGGHGLEVHNKYRIHHKSGLVTVDHFTGNAGMMVTAIDANCRRYECSNSVGPFNKTDLVFEVSWKERPTPRPD